MKIVLLEGLGVSDEVIERHAAKLKEMGHSFFTCEKDPAPQAQLVNSRDADGLLWAAGMRMSLCWPTCLWMSL